ncbi:MAG TPA: hypothetical protein PKW95_07315 [bacterium]|nr:hypothetical protein [bacterium]
MNEPRRARALGMLSGGLDSILAARLMLELGVEVLALKFTAPFIRPMTAGPAAGAATHWAQVLDVPLREVPMGDAFVEVIRQPRYGHGKQLNPCVDCKIHMLALAREIMESEGYDFVFTGEVLGQRPMSQRRDTLAIIETNSGLKGRLLRPLSAQLLPPTIPEEEGLIDREKLLAITGRSRKPQQELARRWHIVDPPGAAGGCLLTDANYAARLRHLLAIKPVVAHDDLELLTVGRHIDIDGRAKVIVSRNEAENHLLEQLSHTGAWLLEPADWPGPTALIVGGDEPGDVEFAAACIVSYGKPKEPNDVLAQKINSVKKFTISAQPADRMALSSRRIEG